MLCVGIGVFGEQGNRDDFVVEDEVRGRFHQFITLRLLSANDPHHGAAGVDVDFKIR
jgi:hypothetical protein